MATPRAIPRKPQHKKEQLSRWKEPSCASELQPPTRASRRKLLDLRQMAAARGFEIVREYSDKLSGTKSKHPGLDALLSDAQRHRFDVVMV